MPNSNVEISSVKLRNFLSFYDGKVEFDPGLTVVFGPNGSGKTSIFHAIKFALGSNQRENRYSKWSDFVRHGASSAEVELVVDVGQRKISFVRKISRDGIPRAYIDGKRVKAAELHSMVDKLGFDVDNPLVFMPQERINAIRDTDPVEIRKLVEEGTGLSVVRDRIVLEESRVSTSKERLIEVSNEAAMVERELELLQHDISRLKRKRELRREEQQIEEELLWATEVDLISKIDTLKAELEDKELGLGEIIEKVTTLEDQISVKETDSSHISKELEGLQNEFGSINARIDEEERRLSKLKEEDKKLAVELGELQQRVSKQERRKKKLTDDLRHAVTAKERFEDKKKSLEESIAENEDELSKIEAELTEFAEWNTRRAEAHGTYRALQTDIRGKDLLLRSIKEKVQNDQAELETIENKWGHVWSVLETTDEKDLVLQKAHLERDIASLNERRFQENTRVSQLQKEIDDLRLKLSETAHRIPEEVRSLREAIEEHSLTSVKGPLVELLQIGGDLSQVLEAVLIENLVYAFIVEDPVEYALLEKLRENIDAPSPILHITNKQVGMPNLPEWKGVRGWLWDELELDDELKEKLNQAIGPIVLVENERTAKRIVEKLGASVVTTDGYVRMVNEHRVVSRPKPKPSGIISTAPIQKRLTSAETELASTRKEITSIMSKLEKATEEREQVMELLGQLTRWSGTWERRKKLLESIPADQERIFTLDDELKKLQEKLGKAERELRKLDSSQPPERSRLVGQKSAIKMKQRRVQQELNDTLSKLHETDRNESLWRQELKQCNGSIDVLGSSLTELREEIKSSKSEGSIIVQTIEELRDGKDKIDSQIDNLRKQQIELATAIRTLNEELLELNVQAKTDRLHLMQSKRQLSNYQQELEESQQRLTGKTRPNQLRPIEKVREALLRVKTLLDDYQDVSETVAHTEDQLKSRMDSLSIKISEIGEELVEAEETLTNIKDQYHNGMNETLRGIENEVNNILNNVGFVGTVRFELSMFSQEYGVEFKSKIKSEEYKSISSGSGGERSLIAIGLILALQRHNPAPVYAMDEIDTFLDATNTEIVSRLLHDSSRRSQFILFTPAKSTHLLKHADKRLGVVSPGGTDPSVIIESPRFAGEVGV